VDDDKVRAFLPRLPEGLSCCNPIPFGNLIFGKDNPVSVFWFSADRHWFIPYFGVI
jgi:hypothetical protein